MLRKTNLSLVILGLCFNWLSAAVAGTVLEPLPRVFCADPQALADVKIKFAAHDPSLQPAFDRLLADASKALKLKPLSVMDKKQIPPNGDMHDYVSQAPYFWRDTNSPDGKYVRRDGQRNPESKIDSDAGRLNEVCSSAQTLALAFYFTGDETYAAKASTILRVFFLNPETKMNPNLNFGQGIPGETTGRPTGLISARSLVDLCDALGLLAESKSWTAADQQAMRAWMEQYFDWLTTSKIGLGEAHAKNNHGTFYDTQVAAIAMFIGKTDAAREIILDACTNRIAVQIEPDGRQPRELARTLSFNYSVFNLRALLDLAGIGQNLDVDLWHYQAPSGGSIIAALDFMAPYVDANSRWPFQQIHKPDRGSLAEILLRAAPHFPQSHLAADLKNFSGRELAANRERLFFKTAQIEFNPSAAGSSSGGQDSHK